MAVPDGNADVRRRTTGEVIPGTEGITPGPAAPLGNRDLEFADLDQLDLTGATFKGSNLATADLSSANLTHADLSLADLTHANFVGRECNWHESSRNNRAGLHRLAAVLACLLVMACVCRQARC